MKKLINKKWYNTSTSDLYYKYYDVISNKDISLYKNKSKLFFLYVIDDRYDDFHYIITGDDMLGFLQTYLYNEEEGHYINEYYTFYNILKVYLNLK